MNFSLKDFFSKREQIRNFLRIWSNLLKKSLTENFIFSAVTEDADEDDSNLESSESDHKQIYGKRSC